MTGSRDLRPSVCYAAPGHSLVSTSGSARNILAAAEALSEWADVTVVFKTIVDPVASSRFQVLAIEQATGGSRRDDVAARGLNPLTHVTDLVRVRNFARDCADRFDLVLEKGWRLSGFMARAFARRGVPAGLIENDARHWSDPVRSLRSAVRFMAHQTAQAVAGYCSRRLPFVIAETQELKAALLRQRGIAPACLHVVGLGVDHNHFAPGDRRAGRQALGAAPNSLTMVYVGGMDLYHDLSPLLEVLGERAFADLELHLVGDGEYRQRYEALAATSQVPVTFHGRIDHLKIPAVIAGADICLAPYRTEAFPAGEVYFSTLKIPEYMACQRPVVSVPSGPINRLIEDGSTGFLIPNEKAAWTALLERLPSRDVLAAMGKAAAASVADMSWRNTALGYLTAAGFAPRGLDR